jgi:uncharacterized membrane protein YfcA
MTLITAALLFVAALFGGALNSIAGGGSFLVFPSLLFTGMAPIQANATNTVAMWVGTVGSLGAYRDQLPRGRRTYVFVGLSLFGGVLGALLLLHTPQALFMRLVPYLLLLATLLFTFGGRLTARFLAARGARPGGAGIVATSVLQVLIAIYGGFFGGGMGILMLAMLAMLGMEDIHEMNALKVLLAICINGVAVVAFAVAGVVQWPQAAVLTVGALLGGYLGPVVARRQRPQVIRGVVSAVGFGLTIYFFVHG